MPQSPYDRLQVFRVDGTEEFHRILWVDHYPDETLRYVLIRLDGPLQMPVWICTGTLAANIAELGWTATDENPFKFSFRSEADLPKDPKTRQRYLSSQQFKLRFVRLVTALGRDAFISRLREARIREIRRDKKAKTAPQTNGTNGAKGALPSASALREWLVLFWRSGEDPAALFPRFNQRGRKPYAVTLNKKDAQPKGKPGRKRKYADANGAWGCDLDGADWGNLQKGARKYLFVAHGRHLTRGRRLPWRQAHKSTLAEFFSVSTRNVRDGAGNAIRVQTMRPPSQRPTLAQFRTAALSDTDLAKRIRQVEGDRAYNTRFRPLPGSSLDIAQAPGAVFQVDWMLAKIWLVSRVDRKPCGWPYVFFVIDCYSRMIVGVYVTFEYPDYRTGAMALLETMSPKVAFAARYGIKLSPDDWPCHHQPDRILNDGGELASKLADFVPEGLSDLATAPAYRPDLKGLVERLFGVSKAGLIEWQSGAAPSDKPDDAPDPSKTSSLTIEEFTGDLIRWVVFEHNRNCISKMVRPIEAIREGVDPIPIQLWNWGIKRLTGRLRRMPRTELIPRLMPRLDAQVTRRGIEITGVRYFSDSALLQRLVHEASLRGKATPIKVACDPNNTNEIFLINPQAKGGFETIPIVANSPYTGMTFEEVRKQRKAEEERRKYLQGIQGVTAVDEERLRQKRTTEAQHERDKKTAASAETPSSPAAQTPAESKAGEISAQLEQERAANATVPSPEPTNGAQRQPSEGVSKPIARRVLRLLQLNPPDENP
jgi:hypothetical protein